MPEEARPLDFLSAPNAKEEENDKGRPCNGRWWTLSCSHAQLPTFLTSMQAEGFTWGPRALVRQEEGATLLDGGPSVICLTCFWQGRGKDICTVRRNEVSTVLHGPT